MTEELIQWLKDHEFDRPDVFQKIAAEEYDKNSFCLATDDDLKDVCRARGPWLQLRRLRDKLKESTNVKESTDSQFHVHLAATSSHPVTVNDGEHFIISHTIFTSLLYICFLFQNGQERIRQSIRLFWKHLRIL
jgi:hypothetical protein